jgi:nitronate monooxygenase
VIGGGGVSDGRALAALLALGAEGVIVGTRFLFSPEAPIHDKLKQALCEAEETDTVLVMRSLGNTHRIWRNERADLIVELESRRATLEEIVAAAAGEKDKRMFESGDVSKGTISVGQGVGLCREVKPCKEIVAEMVAEAERTISRLGSLAR